MFPLDESVTVAALSMSRSTLFFWSIFFFSVSVVSLRSVASVSVGTVQRDGGEPYSSPIYIPQDIYLHRMGNDVKKPAAALLRQPDMFPEVQDAKLSSVKEAADFWMRQYPDTARIGLEEFDELFSCVFKDPEAVYPLFGKRTAVVLDTFCIVALLADESVDAKLRFIFYLFAEDFAADCKMALCRAFLGVMGGVSCLFNCKVPIRDTVLDYVVAAVQKLVDLNSSASRTRIDQKDFPMELDEFIQLVQEDRYISSYTDAVLSMCRTRQYITDAMLTVNRHVQESKLMSGIEEDAKARKKSRHPLWRYTILDLFEQSWLQPLPQMDTHDTVLTVLEVKYLHDILIYCSYTCNGLQHCVLSGKNAVPVYSRTPIDTRKAHTAAATGRSMEMSQAIAAIMRHAGGGATADEDEKQDEHPFQLFDLVDIHTFVYWLAASAPASVVNSRHLEKANEGMSVYAVRKPRRRAKGLTSGSKMGSGVLGAGASSSAKIRRMSTLPIQDQWQEAGVLFATTQIKTACVEEQSIMSSNNKVESPSSKLSGAGTPINIMNAGPGLMSMSSFMEVPHEVRYTQANVFQTDQYMYNVIEQVAKGFRLIPIASSRLKPYTVTQIVSTKQVVSFLRLYATELLGKLAVKPIGRSGLMRKAPSIPREANFGTAIVALSESKFECIPVTDDQMRFCSRIDASSVQHFWWTWKLNLIRRTGTTATLEALQHEYSKNNVLIPSGSGLNFSYFSSLLSPLNQCGELGIHLNDFDEVSCSIVLRDLHRLTLVLNRL